MVRYNSLVIQTLIFLLSGSLIRWYTYSGPDQRRIMQSISSSIMSHTEPVAGSPPSRHFQLSSSRSSAFNPPIPPNVMPIGGFVGPTKSFNVYTRMLTKDGKETLFELRGHPYFGVYPVFDERAEWNAEHRCFTGDEAEDPNTPSSPGSNAGFDGGGVMGTTRGHRQSFAQNANHIGDNVIDDDERPCKAFWIMGRKWAGHGDGGAKMLDSFLELKMENERLKQELRVSEVNMQDLRRILTGFASRICKIDHTYLVSTET